ncbi:3'-5' exonuclease [Thaumasiovibrio subtropicus]|uniref:3'-5' exonuclease n=1 Tax=Thaumasiovibrio subtropicus TaxID=1891207 RepID=UPI000B359359|nr:3'-5' exonuclease [Thaumasiovibrio subtropicus]
MNILQRLWYRHQLKETDYAALFERYQGSELVSLDCETTSLNPDSAELVTIAATKIHANRVLTSQSLSLTLRPPGSLDAGSVTIHRLRHQDLHQGQDIEDALTQLLDFIGNRPLVGYHIQYDKQILDRYFQRYFGFPLPNKIVEVSFLYQERLERMLPNAYCDLSLDSMSKQLNLPLPDRHDAMEDAIAAALIYVRLKHGGMPSIQSQ